MAGAGRSGAELRRLREELCGRLALPVLCAPMYDVSGFDLLLAARREGLMAGLPLRNPGGLDALSEWLGEMDARLAGVDGAGPIALGLSSRIREPLLGDALRIARDRGVRYFISAAGDPSALVPRVHAIDGVVLHDVTEMRFIAKAIDAGVDGLIFVGQGGGGQSGRLSPLAHVPPLRERFEGIIIVAGGIASGQGIRAALALGADCASIGTRFIATQEAQAPIGFKQALVAGSVRDLVYSDRITGIPTNWFAPSLAAAGVDLEALTAPVDLRDRSHLPPGARPWVDLWSAGEAIESIADIPSVAALVRRLRQGFDAGVPASL